MDNAPDNEIISEDNYEKLLLKVIPYPDEISFKEFVSDIIVFLVYNTTDVKNLLLHLLQTKLLTDPDVSRLKEKRTSSDRSDSLYRESLCKRVKSREDYEFLFNALFKTGNKHIVEKIFKELRNHLLKQSSSSAPSSSANTINSRSDPGVRSNNSKEISPCSPETAENEEPTVNRNASSETADPGQPNPSGSNSPPDPPVSGNESLISTPSIPETPGDEAFSVNQNASKVFNPPGFEDQDQPNNGASIPLLPPEPINTSPDSSPSIQQSVGHEDSSVNQNRRREALGIAEQGRSNGTRNNIYCAASIAVVLLVLGIVGGMVYNTRTSNDQNDKLDSKVFVPTDTNTHSQPERTVTTEESTSRDQITSPGWIIMRLRIGAPSDLPDFPVVDEIYLTINKSKGVPWEKWFPQNGDKVMLLRLYGTFSLPEIRQFLRIMNKVTTLCIYNLNVKSCRKNWRNNLKEFSIESNHPSAGISEAGGITFRPKNIPTLTIGAPTDLDDLPERDEIHLKIYTSEGVPWGGWSPINADRVTLLELNGTFSPADIQHLLTIMTNLAVLCVDKLVGSLCEDSF